MERELGNDLVKVENVSHTIDGEKILDNVSFIIRPGEKVALLSRNDLATTTLMQILAGEIKPDEGTVTWGQTTSQSYMSKDLNASFDNDELSILDWLRQFATKEQNDNTFLRGFLGKMLFSGDDIDKQIKVLSGGEKVARLKRMEAKRIPANIDYEKIDGLATEGRQKLEKIRPETLAQASRISGVNPADIAILSVYIRK